MTDTGQEGVRDWSMADCALTEARTLPPSKAGFRNPGATPNLRGVEANTNESKGMPCGEPEGITGYSCKDELPAGYGMGGMSGGSGDEEGGGD